MNVARCRSCRAPVIWAETKNSRAPFDEEPSADGTFLLEEATPDRVTATYLPKGTRPQLHTNHFATCPQKDQWRKG